MTAEQRTIPEQTPDNRDVRRQQIEQLYSHAGTSIAGSLAAAILLFAVFLSISPVPILATWMGIYVIVIGARFWMVRSYFSSSNRHEHIARWYLLFLCTLTLVGALWGISGLVLIPADIDPTTALVYSSIAALFASVVATAALASYAVKLSACISFVTVCLLPMGIVFTFFSEDLKRTIGLMVSILLIFLILMSIRLNRTILGWIQISIEHNELLSELEQEHFSIKNVNEELRHELSQREIIEEELRHEKEKAERLADQLRALSSRDGLTGIANRRHFDEFVEREWGRSQRNKKPLSLLLCDIDYFKNYNDVYGHQKGDQCLKQIAQTLNSKSRRGSDLCARYGGEEFAVVLAETNADAALQLAESMRDAIEQLKIPHCASEAGSRVTMSFGVATITPGPESSIMELIQMADTALYNAKVSGRNTVVSADTKFEHTESNFEKIELNKWNADSDGELSSEMVRKKFHDMGFRCHLQSYDPDTTMGTHASMRDEIHAVIEGQLSIRIEDKQYILDPGDYISLPKGLTRRTMVCGDESVRVIVAIRADQAGHE